MVNNYYNLFNDLSLIFGNECTRMIFILRGCDTMVFFENKFNFNFFINVKL